MYDSGWENDWTTLDHAKTLKVIDARSRDVTAARKALDEVEWYKSPSAPVASPDDGDDYAPED